ncbi:MAG: hypothetical protein OXH09_07765 [Gammaproteobacteria bacterium]|nr:hypothetical protein [Gammaproteobacteria bacterium]
MEPIYNRIELRINPRWNIHKNEDHAFLKSLRALTKSPPLEPDPRWPDNMAKAMQQARELLKREWEVTKSVIPGDWKSRIDDAEGRKSTLY